MTDSGAFFGPLSLKGLTTVCEEYGNHRLVNKRAFRYQFVTQSVATVAMRDRLGVSMSTEWMADGKCREYPAGTFFREMASG